LVETAFPTVLSWPFDKLRTVGKKGKLSANG